MESLAQTLMKLEKTTGISFEKLNSLYHNLYVESREELSTHDLDMLQSYTLEKIMRDIAQ